MSFSTTTEALPVLDGMFFNGSGGAEPHVENEVPAEANPEIRDSE